MATTRTGDLIQVGKNIRIERGIGAAGDRWFVYRLRKLTEAERKNTLEAQIWEAAGDYADEAAALASIEGAA